MEEDKLTLLGKTFLEDLRPRDVFTRQILAGVCPGDRLTHLYSPTR